MSQGSPADRLLAEIATAREGLVRLCGALVAAPSVTPPGDTRRVADVAQAYLESEGLEVERLAARPDMPNLVAVCEGRGDGPHLVMNGHLDTMEPGDERQWSVPPFRLTRRDGRLYGLGMGNMKGAVAAMCLAVAVLHRHRSSWTGRVTLTLVSDEVCFGSAGSAYLLDQRPSLRGDALLSGEGAGWMRLAPAEKGLGWLRLSAVSRGGHASAAEPGESAVAKLAAAVTAVDGLNRCYVDPPADLKGLVHADDDPAMRVSANVGTIAGGTVPNQVAASARAEVDFRLPPGLSVDELIRRTGECIAGIPGVDRTVIKGFDPNWTSPDHPFVRTVAGALSAVRAPVAMTVRLPASDARYWRGLGVPAVCLGPQPTLSAGTDDYANESDVLACAQVYALTAQRLGETSLT